MNNDIRFQYIKKCEREFKDFVGLAEFPEYEIKCKEMTLDKLDAQGYDAVASAYYDLATGKHSLEIPSDLHIHGEAGKRTVFHELTHILDDEILVNRDACKYIANHGYTEYHASQIEFLQILGVKSLKQPISFSMNDRIGVSPCGYSIREFVEEPHTLASSLIRQSDFPANFNTLKDTLGLIFNYYGRRSICKMYALDYQDNTDDSAISKLLTPCMVNYLNTYMTGWFDKTKIDILGNFYYRDIFCVLLQQYRVP